MQGKNVFPPELLTETADGFALLNTLLEKSKYAAGDEVTIADFCLIACITTLEFYVPIDNEKYPKLSEWDKRIRELPYYHVSEPGLERYKKMAKERLKQ